jgi:hypothetical protein
MAANNVAADGRTLVIPGRIEEAVTDVVVRHLETELGNRGLLVAADGLAAAAAEAAQSGTRLLTHVIHRCYPINRQTQALAIEFESEGHAARLAAALAFGAVTARVLAPSKRESEPTTSEELLSAMFNLGIGLVDGLCDEDIESGEALLGLVHEQDLIKAAEEPRGRDWLRAVLPPALGEDHAVAFTVDIIETFFETLHAFCPDDASLHYRRDLGMQLEAALEAERQSVNRSPEGSARERLIDCSRLTSVIPFQVIETLAGGNAAATDRTAGTLLGEAMWRIDDLVDLCQDARSGALNGVLLAATEQPGRDVVAALEHLLTSKDIASAAHQAAESLLAGLQRAGGGRVNAQHHEPSWSFLYFVQRYAGIAPRQTS